MDLEAGMAASLLQLNNTQAGGVPGGDQGAADAIPGPSVEPFHLPARPIQATPLAPVIVMPRPTTTPAPAQPGQQSQVERARLAVEDERRRAVEIYEANAEAQARDVVPYNPDYDFSFLQICKYKSNSNEHDTNKNLPTQADLGRASAVESRGVAATRTSPGRRPTGASRPSSPRIENVPQVTTPEVRELKNNPTQLTNYPKVEEEEVTKTVAPTSSAEEVANADATDDHKERVTTAKEDNADLEDRNTNLMAQPCVTMTDSQIFINTNTPQTRGFTMNKHTPVNTNTFNLISPTNCKVIDKGNYNIGNEKLSKVVKLTNGIADNNVDKPTENIIKSTLGGKNIKGNTNEPNTNSNSKGNNTPNNKKSSEKNKVKQTGKIIKGNQNIDQTRKSPEFIYGINTRKKAVNELLQRAISNAKRHGLNLKPGQINNNDGNCLWEALIYNIIQRACIKNKNRETPRQLRKRSIEKAQKDAELKKLPCIPENTTEDDWTKIKKDKVYETELGDFCIMFAARALKRNILVFNTNTKTGAAPITLIRAETYEGGVLTDNNPLLVAYDSVHFESLETISRQDELRAIELVQMIETGKYKMTHINTQKMTVITQNKIPKKNGKKINHGKRTHNLNTHKYKCDVCNISYQGSAELTTHNKKIHTLNECRICKTQTYGEDDFNDHTKACKHQRDRIRQENDKKDRERKKANPKYKNMYNHLMVEMHRPQKCCCYEGVRSYKSKPIIKSVVGKKCDCMWL